MGFRIRVIDDFHAEPYAFLSNAYETAVLYEGLVFGSAEAAFQAQKCRTWEERGAFADLSPARSRNRGRQVPLRADWEKVRLTVMEKIVMAKFSQHPDLASRLLRTGESLLVEGNDGDDGYWGVDRKTGEGDNHLGKILMRVRKRMREEMKEERAICGQES